MSFLSARSRPPKRLALAAAAAFLVGLIAAASSAPASAATGGGCRRASTQGGANAIAVCISASGNYVKPDFYIDSARDCYASIYIVQRRTVGSFEWINMYRGEGSCRIGHHDLPDLYNSGRHVYRVKMGLVDEAVDGERVTVWAESPYLIMP